MTVITISRQYGSGGDEIASRVCEILGYQAFDKRLIAQSVHQAGLSEQEVIDYSEENHKIRNFLHRLFGWSETIATIRIWKEVGTNTVVVEDVNLTEEAAVALVQKTVLSAYRAGNLVILGRGGQVILKGQPDVLHVRIEAPLEDRVQRIKQQIKSAVEETFVAVDLRREGKDLISQKDASSQDYIQRFYNEDWSNPLLYHVVLNTGKMSIEQAARTIVDLVKIQQAEHRPDGKEK